MYNNHPFRDSRVAMIDKWEIYWLKTCESHSITFTLRAGVERTKVVNNDFNHNSDLIYKI